MSPYRLPSAVCQATFETADHSLALSCAISREHERGGVPSYGLAFHPRQHDFLAAAPEACVAFGCGSPEAVLLIPFAEFQEWLEGMGTTEREDRFYWQVVIYREAVRRGDPPRQCGVVRASPATGSSLLA